MKITKIGHCCLLIEYKGRRILTDPGAYSDGQNSIENIDIILITHEHADHLHTESLQKIISNNPSAKIYTNKGVGKLLDAENIAYDLLENEQEITYLDILIQGYGIKHADLYPSITPVDNTGYFIDNIFYYPGDALYDPKREVAILALPVAGPWLTLGSAVNYAKQLKPKVCFPVHDGMLKHLGSVHNLPKAELPKDGIAFIPMIDGDSHDFADFLRE